MVCKIQMPGRLRQEESPTSFPLSQNKAPEGNVSPMLPRLSPITAASPPHLSQTHHPPVSFVCVTSVIFLECEGVLHGCPSTNVVTTAPTPSNLVEQSHSGVTGEVSGHWMAVTTSTPEAQVGGCIPLRTESHLESGHES